MESSEKLATLKNLFSLFEAALNDVTEQRDENTARFDAGQAIVMDTRYEVDKVSCSSVNTTDDVELLVKKFDRNTVIENTSVDLCEFVGDFEQDYDTAHILRSIVFHHQESQETLSHRRNDIVQKIDDHLTEISRNEDTDMAVETFPMCKYLRNVNVAPDVQTENIMCRRYPLYTYQVQQHQKIQETLGYHQTDNVLNVLNRTDELVRHADTVEILQSNHFAKPTSHVENIVGGHSESLRFLHNEIGTSSRKQGNPKKEHNYDEANISQDTDDCDEEMFRSFVETSEDLEDVECSPEGQSHLPSIIATLNERQSEKLNSLPNDNDAVQCESTPAVLLNHLELNAKRLVGSLDTTKMFIETSDKKGKKLCCPFCFKLICKLSRHIQTVHKDEAEVKKLAAIPRDEEFKKQRWHVQNAMKIDGLVKWNTDKSINLTGQMIVPRRPNLRLNRNATNFLICPNCLSFHTMTNLRNHFNRCTNGAMKGTRNIKILARTIEGRISSNASEQLRDLFPVMKEDPIVQLIRYDWLLIAYGNILCMKYSFHYQQNMIRAKLRLAGRVLQALKGINSAVTDFASIFRPKHYKTLIEAIKIVGKFDSATNEFGAPATSASAITSIKQIGKHLRCEYIEKENSEHVKRTADFLYLMESEFSSIINKRVKECQLKRKRDKDHKIPSKEDVRLLSVFVKQERNLCFEELSAKFSFKKWVTLSRLTIASIIVFNRRRTGESQNILESDFDKRESINDTSNEELFAALSEESKKVAERYSRMKIRGKRGFINVNVLMEADLISCIELILSHRLEAGIPLYNPYLFALPSPPGEKRIRVVNACYVLASLSKLCGAKDPSTLRGTNLRKHFASACMAKELSDDMVSEVAKHMGHRESVHREHYRHNTIDREIVKMVELLKSAQGIEDDDDGSDSDSDTNDNEDYVTLPMSALHAGPKKRRKIAVVSSSQKQKKKMQTLQPPELYVPSLTSSESASRTGRKCKSIERNEHPGNPGRKKITGNRNYKNKLNAAPVSYTERDPQAGRKLQPAKVGRKRMKVEGKINKLSEGAASVSVSDKASKSRVNKKSLKIII